MNNIICCECLDCGNEFIIGVSELLEADQEAFIGESVWCGVGDSHRYDCYWGLFVAGHSSNTIADVLRIWAEWADSHRRSRSS